MSPALLHVMEKGNDRGNQDRKVTPRTAHSRCRKTARDLRCYEGASRKHRGNHLPRRPQGREDWASLAATGSKTLQAQ